MKDAKLLTDIARPYFEKTAKKWKQKILYIAPWPPTGLWSKEKVQTVEDMKGRKVRTYDKNGALLVKSLGGTPYALPDLPAGGGEADNPCGRNRHGAY